MAELAVYFAVKKLGDLLKQETISLDGVRDQLERLKRELGDLLDQEAIGLHGARDQVEGLKRKLGDLLDQVEGLKREQVEVLERELGNLLKQEAISLHGVRNQVKGLKRELGDLLEKATNLYGVRGEVELLKGELETMQCFLKDADEKKNEGYDERVELWVTHIRDIAFEVEDFIDVYMDFQFRRQQKNGRLGFRKRRFVFIFDKLVRRHKVRLNVEGLKVKLRENVEGIKARLHKLSESRERYGIAKIDETNGTTSQSRSRVSIPMLPQLFGNIDMVGCDDEKKKIVQELVDINNTNRSVISIVGMGGLGKTTLAISVYNDFEVKRSFDIFAFLFISQQYNIFESLKGISSQISVTPSTDTIQDFSIAISEKLRKGKYLIVLDDVWKEDAWIELQKVFPDINNGSRVIITTRLAYVAKIANPTTKPHELRSLDEKESWELFLRWVFPNQNIETCCPTSLVDYAHQLVQRCGGLPLALVFLRALISTKPQTQDAWREVVEQFVGGGERCLKILALSYYDLPYYLKFCLLYFGCFPKGMDIPAKTLIRLWSAGDVLPSRNGKTTEEIGMDCLEELEQRYLIQVTGRKYDDSAQYYQIHDLLHDLCIMEAKDRRFLEIYENSADFVRISTAARHLIIFNHIEIRNYSNSNLQGLFYSNHNHPMTFNALEGQLGGFKLLKVLYLNCLDMSKFPSEIKSLIHLRYLELHADNLEEVPSWIGQLRVLQTFIIRSKILEFIPDSLWRIESLMHVEVPTSSVTLRNMGHTVLKKLHTLEGVVAGSWVEYMLGKLTNLSTLNICEVSDDHANALSSALPKLGRLASFSMDGDVIPSDKIIKAFSNQSCLKKLSLDGKLNCKRLPHNDEFPPQLLSLSLIYSELEHDPMETLEKLPCLKHLELGDDSYGGTQMICSAKGFPQLLSLSIRCCDELEEWKIHEGAMPCLKSLQLCYCPKLRVIPEGLKNVPLDQLVLRSMSEELRNRMKENIGEDWYKIRHVPNISIRP